MSLEQFTGSDVILPCNITGTATEVTWYFNNQQITASGSTKYSNGDVVNPSLTITDVVMGDAGSYYCQATNGVTTVTSRIITLNVKGTYYCYKRLLGNICVEVNILRLSKIRTLRAISLFSRFSWGLEYVSCLKFLFRFIRN